MNEVIREFLLETHENLAELDADLIALEQDPTGRETLARAFRTLHTVKGTAGFLGFVRLQSLAHAAENLLSKLRAGEARFDQPIASALLAVVDAIRQTLATVEADGSEGSADHTDLISRLEQLRENASPPPPKKTVSTPKLSPSQTTRPSTSDSSGFFVDGRAAVPQPPSLPPAPRPATTAKTTSTSSAETGQAPLPPAKLSSPPRTAPTRQPQPPPRQTPPKQPQSPAPSQSPAPTSTPAPTSATLAQIAAGSTLIGIPAAKRAPSDALNVPNANPAENSEPRTAAVSDSSLRVDVGVLDQLMTLVGELVLARNQIVQISSTEGLQDHPALMNTVQRLNLLTSELQDQVMKTRMQPIGNVWGKFPRVVRDLSVACGKQVRLVMEGQETELDKTIIEAIRDPLTHIVRNAIDHGIEKPETRLSRGKPAEGQLRLKAYHEGGKVWIEISDDGGGIDPQRVLDKAIRMNLITADDAAGLAEHEIVSLVFLPGFSTSDQVTHFSGRGVGMDVVRTHIEKVGGMVELESHLGEGTTVLIKIPLTLAIIPALSVSCGGERFCIPQVTLEELVRLDGDAARSGIESVHGAPVYRLRGDLLPIVDLAKMLRLTADAGANAKPGADDAINLVVLQADDRKFGLVVDAIHDTEEIVVKPLRPQLKELGIYAGATILGDGRVALILDTRGIAHRAGLVSETRIRAVDHRRETITAADENRESLLIFIAGDGQPMALPLHVVDRLEELAPADFERVGDRFVIQYRGAILPLIRPFDSPSANPRPDQATLPVIVCSAAGRRFGLIVDSIQDVCDEPITTVGDSVRPESLATAVLQGRVTSLLDVEAIVARLAPPSRTDHSQQHLPAHAT